MSNSTGRPQFLHVSPSGDASLLFIVVNLPSSLETILPEKRPARVIPEDFFRRRPFANRENVLSYSHDPIMSGD
jgi:hypothetical protein